MDKNTYKKVKVEFFNNPDYKDEFDSGTHIVEYVNCSIIYSGNHVIFEESTENGVIGHVFELRSVKIFKYGD